MSTFIPDKIRFAPQDAPYFDGDLASPVPPCPRCSSTGGEALTFEYQALLGGRYYCPDCGAAYGERLKDGEA